MDYEIRPVSRRELRLYAQLFRSLCEYTEDEPIDPIYLLEILPDIESFGNVKYEILYNNGLPGNVPAKCSYNNGVYVIQIKESVYNSAYERKVGGSRMHITHEIMHVYLDKLDIKPISINPPVKSTPAYCRLEWAVKAIAGELMLPYNATQGMSEKELMKCYGVSSSAAKKRLSY